MNSPSEIDISLQEIQKAPGTFIHTLLSVMIDFMKLFGVWSGGSKYRYPSVEMQSWLGLEDLEVLLTKVGKDVLELGWSIYIFLCSVRKLTGMCFHTINKLYERF